MIARVRPARRHVLRAGSAVAAVEFALVAPIMIILVLAVFDAGRAYIAWQQVNSAALAIAAAAEKLSVTPGQTTTSLTSGQMQQAMSSIYAEMPWLARGTGNGLFPGPFSVTLSEVVFCPSRTAAAYAGQGCATSTTGPQIGYTMWSTYLQFPTAGGVGKFRPCNVPLVMEYPTWDSKSLTPAPTRVQQMVDPSNNNAAGVTLTPQVVADVQYTFTTTFGLILPVGKTVTFTATAMLPTPFGDNTQAITYTPVKGDPLIVNSCTLL